MGGFTPQPVKKEPAGAVLAVVLWALVAIGALTMAAATVASLDLALAGNHRAHAAALAAAEAGLAVALAAVAADPARGLAPDSISGSLEGGPYLARWEPVADGLHVVAEGGTARARRRVEAWISFDAAGALRIAEWREVR